MGDVALLGGQRIAAANFRVLIDENNGVTGDYLGSDGFDVSAGTTVSAVTPNNCIAVELTLARDINFDDCAVAATPHFQVTPPPGPDDYIPVNVGVAQSSALGESTRKITAIIQLDLNVGTPSATGFYIAVFRLNRG